MGMTGNVEKRVKSHNAGLQKSTKGYVPWRLVGVESFATRKEAREREKYLKSGSAKERMKQKHRS